MLKEPDKLTPQPILKWPGGKRRVLPHLLPYFPENYDTYYEPFLGGAAVYLHLAPQKAILSDINDELINLYSVIKTKPSQFKKELKKIANKNTLEDFLEIRALDRDPSQYSKLTQEYKAARTVYLNKTCFNGLHRTNSLGQFNTPYGYYEKPNIFDEKNIDNINKIFSTSQTTLQKADFIQTLSNITTPKNLIYLDPPYIPLSPTSSFTNYSKEKFGLQQQQLLANIAKEMDEAGNYIIISNSDTPTTRELYKNFYINEIQVRRSIGAASKSRNKVGELIIIGNTLKKALTT